MVSFAQIACSIAAVVGLSLTAPVAAAEPESCLGLIASRDALFARAALRQDKIGLTFIGHATFLIETRKGCGLPLTTATVPVRPSRPTW